MQMKDLPELQARSHPDPHVSVWSEAEMQAIKSYAMLAAESFEARIRELEGKLDICKRTAEGESAYSPASLAVDYGGTGWEYDPAVKAVTQLSLRVYGNDSHREWLVDFTDTGLAISAPQDDDHTAETWHITAEARGFVNFVYRYFDSKFGTKKGKT